MSDVDKLRESTARAVAGLKWHIDEHVERLDRAEEERDALRERVAKLEALLSYVREDQKTGQHTLVTVAGQAAELRGRDAVHTESKADDLERERLRTTVKVGVPAAIASVIAAAIAALVKLLQ